MGDILEEMFEIALTHFEAESLPPFPMWDYVNDDNSEF